MPDKFANEIVISCLFRLIFFLFSFGGNGFKTDRPKIKCHNKLNWPFFIHRLSFFRSFSLSPFLYGTALVLARLSSSNVIPNPYLSQVYKVTVFIERRRKMRKRAKIYCYVIVSQRRHEYTHTHTQTHEHMHARNASMTS